MLNLILWIIIGVILILMAFMLILKAFITGQIWKVAKIVGVLIIVLLIYYYIIIYLHAFYMSLVPSTPENIDMEVWDNIWYAILIVLIIMLCTVFIKSLKKNDLQFNLITNSIIVFGIFILYNIMYYLYVYYDRIIEISGKLTMVVLISTFIVWLMSILGVPRSITTPIYIIYSVLVITYLMAIFFVLHYILSMTYDFLAQGKGLPM